MPPPDTSIGRRLCALLVPPLVGVLCGGCGARRPAASEPSVPTPAIGGQSTASADLGGPQAPPPASAAELARGTGTEADRALARGDAALSSGDWAAARSAYAAAGQLEPEDPAPRLGALRVELASLDLPSEFGAATGNVELERLLEQLRALVRRAPDYAPAQLELGRVLLMLGDAREAVEILTPAANVLEADAEAQSALAVALLATGQADRAVSYFRKASELEPNALERLMNLGTAYLMVGQPQAALVTYRRARELAPEHPRLLNDLATAELALGRAEPAVELLERALALEPDRAGFLSNLGYAHQQLGQLDRAVAAYRRATELEPTLNSAWINLATALARQGDFDAAEQALLKARSNDPDDPRVDENLRELEALRRGETQP